MSLNNCTRCGKPASGHAGHGPLPIIQDHLFSDKMKPATFEYWWENVEIEMDMDTKKLCKMAWDAAREMRR